MELINHEISRDYCSLVSIGVILWLILFGMTMYIFYILIHMQYAYPCDLTEVEEELKCITEKLRISKDEAVKEAISFLLLS